MLGHTGTEALTQSRPQQTASHTDTKTHKLWGAYKLGQTNVGKYAHTAIQSLENTDAGTYRHWDMQTLGYTDTNGNWDTKTEAHKNTERHRYNATCFLGNTQTLGCIETRGNRKLDLLYEEYTY